MIYSRFVDDIAYQARSSKVKNKIVRIDKIFGIRKSRGFGQKESMDLRLEAWNERYETRREKNLDLTRRDDRQLEPRRIDWNKRPMNKQLIKPIKSRTSYFSQTI